MTVNPFDIMKNFQALQAKIGEMQSKVKHITAKGSAGGDMVSVELNGQFNVVNVRISPTAVDPLDIGMLEDLVLAAFTDAMNKLKEKLKEEVSAATGGFNIPPGFLGL